VVTRIQIFRRGLVLTVVTIGVLSAIIGALIAPMFAPVVARLMR
jgi:hypothetical protein